MFSKSRIQKEKEKASQITTTKGFTASQLRVQFDLNGLEKLWSDHLTIQDTTKLNLMTLTLIPKEGIWKDQPHEFEINIPNEYPFKPPKIFCKTKIWHPNIDSQSGAVCLSLRYHVPSLSLNAIFFGLYFLFLEPNPYDILNEEAGRLMIDQPKAFANPHNESRLCDSTKNYISEVLIYNSII